MEDALAQVLHDTPEIDSELLDDQTEVLGVVASDNQGLCLLSQGNILDNVSQLAASLTTIASELEPENQEVPIIILDSDSKKLIIKKEGDVIVSILKKST